MTKSAQAHSIILAFNAGREPERLAMKYEAMADNIVSFLRGSCHLFYDRLAELGALGTAPAAWCCNDLHLENFGTYLGNNGLVYFDVNDFDEAALAPVDWDILRLATSVLVSARDMEMPRKTAVDLATQAIDRYRAAIKDGKARWIERKTADGPIGVLIEALKERDQSHFLEKRAKNGDDGLCLNLKYKRMLAIDAKAREALRTFTAKLVISGHDHVEHPVTFTLLDAARRIAGTGNLGNPRFVLLVERTDRPGKPLLLDLKFAQDASAAPHSPFKQPDWESQAARIVALQHHGQAATPKFLQPETVQGAPFVLKELQPTDDRLKVKKLAKDQDAFASALGTMASLAAWMHLRTTGYIGSATRDELIAHVSTKGFASDILARARLAERAVEDDHKEFAAAFADGAVKA